MFVILLLFCFRFLFLWIEPEPAACWARSTLSCISSPVCSETGACQISLQLGIFLPQLPEWLDYQALTTGPLDLAQALSLAVPGDFAQMYPC